MHDHDDKIAELTMELLCLKSKVAYLTGKCEAYESYFDRERERLMAPRSRSHADREESLVEHRNRLVDGVPPASNEHAVFVAKDLSEPLSTSGAGSVEVDVEPEALLNTAGVESAEKLSSANGEESGGHSAPVESEALTDDYILEVIELIWIDIVKEIDDQRLGVCKVGGGSAMNEMRHFWRSMTAQQFFDCLKNKFRP